MSEQTNIIQEMADQSGKSVDEIKKMIDAKIEKFKGLLTEQGAAFMIQKEMGLKQNEAVESKINELKDGMKNVELKGIIKNIYPIKEFEKNGKKGKLKSLLLEDETGVIRVTLWNDQIDKYDLTVGSEITIQNGFVSSYNEKKQISLGFNGTIKINNRKEEIFQKINDLKSGLSSANVYGRVIRTFPCKEFDTGKRKGKVCNFQFGDETALLRATAWNDKADEVQEYNEGDKIKIQNAYTKNGMFGVELHLGYSARLDKTEEEIAPVSKILKDNIPQKNINQLSENENVIIQGKIGGVDQGKLHYLVCEKCGKKALQEETGNICEKCGEINGKPKAVISVTVEDETASIRANFFGKEALQLLQWSQENLEQEINEKSPEKIIEELNEKMTGQTIKLFGYEKINSYSEEKEFNVKEVI